MKVIVDTNIAFSAMLNRSRNISQLLFRQKLDLDLYAPELLLVELARYRNRIQQLGGLSDQQFESAFDELAQRIQIVEEHTIAAEFWLEAVRLVGDVDVDDVAFVALTLSIPQAKLRTGDKRLFACLISKGFTRAITTQDIGG